MKPRIYFPVRTLVLILLSASLLAAASEADAEREVLAAMDGWKQAVMKRDQSALEKVYHPNLIYAHSNGLVENRDQQIRHMIGSKADYAAIPTSHTQVQVHGSMALVATKMDFHQVTAGNRVVVKMQVLMAWLKGAEGWQMIGRQSTRPDAE